MNDNPLDFLRSIYMDEEVPLPTRIKAATEAAQYVHPKLAMVATANANGDFGAMLERAIAASNAVRKTKLIAQEVSSAKMGKSFAPLRRRA